MTDGQYIDDRQNQGNPNLDWTRKGFGWVPDYPDIRDFFPLRSTEAKGSSLQKEIQKDGLTDVIDDLTTDLVAAIHLLLPQSGSQNDNLNDLQQILERLQKRSDGGVRFNATRIYRVLSKDTTSKNINGRQDQEDTEQQQEILQLKKQLYFLIQEGILTENKFIQNKEDESCNNNPEPLFKQPEDKINWLTRPLFDDETESLVMQFQAKQLQDTTLRVDGIVGFNTLLTLEKCLANPEEYKKQNDCSQSDTGNSTRIKNPAKLVTISCLVPDEIFGDLIDHLYNLDQDQLSSTIPLDKAFPISYTNLITLFQPTEEHGKTTRGKSKTGFKQLEDKFKKLEDKLKQKNTQITRNQLIEICKSEFLVIDPIVSAILMMNAPLANQNSIGKFISRGLQKFEDLLRALNASSKSENELLALAAVVKAQETLLIEKSELIDDIKTSVQNISAKEVNQCVEEYDKLRNNLYPTFVFYSLLEKVILKWNNIESVKKSKEDLSSNKQEEFSKKELFELIQTGKTASTQSTFPVRLEIILPVSSSSTRLKKDESAQKVPYFFLPGAVDLSYWCSPIEDQGTLNTCTACAGVGLLEYFAKRTFGEFEDLSPLFLYKAARDLRQRFGDVGAPLRDIMRAMILFGVAPERYWPYRPGNLDAEPPALCYSYAQNYQTLKYFRLDRSDLSARNLLLTIKAVLSAGFPCMFGFTAYNSIHNQENIKNGYITFPNRDRDRVVGGHAVVAVGYNDYKLIPYPDGTERSGALLIRNSWGREWGLEGYAWLPYDYVLKGLTGDWWSLLKAEWFGQGYFGLEASDPGGPGGTGQARG